MTSLTLIGRQWRRMTRGERVRVVLGSQAALVALWVFCWLARAIEIIAMTEVHP